MTCHVRNIRPAAIVRGACVGLAATLLWAPVASADAQTADLVEKVSPSVVTVLSTQEVKKAEGFGGRASPFPPGSPFDEFFKRFGAPRGMPEPNGGKPAQALGSGFLIDGEGYIVTNNHVIENASKIHIRLTDEREFDATLVGTDPQTDIALLKVTASDLPYLKMGDSDAMRVGDDVVAVGNPFGLGGTVTRGIVSAKGRDIKAGPYVDFIQTDAAINHGNSGGPLFNMEGEVIGVNAAIYSPSGGSVGVGFAIPSNTVKYVVSQLRADGEVQRGWLGVSIQNVSPDIATALGMEEPHGALVAQVVDGAPADGVLKAGDVISRFNGADVASSHDLPRLVAAVKAGTRVDVEILRDGETKTVQVKIGVLDDNRQAANDTDTDGTASERLGAKLAALTPELRARFELAEEVKGAMVVDIDPNGPAAEAGLTIGDVIERVGDRDVSSPDELADAVEALDKGAALFLVQRHGGKIFVGVPLNS